MTPLRLYVSVPIASFRVAQAREYWETYPCPPAATVYGMLLSMVGEESRTTHAGAEVALAMVSEPAKSTVIRTLWRVKKSSSRPGVGENKRPDYQELLTGVRISVWVRRGGAETAGVSLAERLAAALENPAALERFGGLSLGESTHIIDEARQWRGSDPHEGRMLLNDGAGPLSMPVWPDHVGSAGTRWGQYRLDDAGVLPNDPPEHAWTVICPLVWGV